MPSHHAARLRLLALWVAVFAHAAAVAAVVNHSINLLQPGVQADFKSGLFAAWLGLSTIPALMLLPLIGPLAGSRWSRGVLVIGAAVALAVIGFGASDRETAWLSCAGVLALEASFAAAAVIALAPAIAGVTRLRLPTVVVLLTFAAFGGLVCGYWVAIDRAGSAVSFALLGAAVALIAAIGAGFEPAEPLSLREGLVRPFLAGTRDTMRQPRAGSALVGLVLWSFVAMACVIGAIRLSAADTAPEADATARDSTLRFAAALLGGIILAAINRHAFRHAWLIPFAGIAALACALWLRFGESWAGPLVGLGLCLGATFTPLLSWYLSWSTPKHHGVAAGLVVGAWCVASLGLAGLLVSLPPGAGSWDALLTVLVVVSALAAGGAIIAFFRPALEGTAEAIIWPAYRIRATGPGLERLPTHGPCLVIGNHAAWFDPLFVAKVLPAPSTPMMTSRFYDLPVLSWLMRKIVKAIRVPESTVRRDAPELREAVAALDRGESIILFPEGYLRRKQEVPLRRFGRGVWQILHDRPSTPVYACWIDGNWGSYFSYKGGPPTKNKKFDFWRPIRIGFIGPFTVDPATLADHMATRTFLMGEVNRAREPLGLEPLPLAALSEGDKE
ncbi:MAG TPA: lysophospholipid acyltransferase family protein [Gemmataceae bacterium]|nr:lysophospholipid acyltransferase family protein [Gemmataceae bacterium]